MATTLQRAAVGQATATRYAYTLDFVASNRPCPWSQVTRTHERALALVRRIYPAAVGGYWDGDTCPMWRSIDAADRHEPPVAIIRRVAMEPVRDIGGAVVNKPR